MHIASSYRVKKKSIRPTHYPHTTINHWTEQGKLEERMQGFLPNVLKGKKIELNKLAGWIFKRKKNYIYILLF